MKHDIIAQQKSQPLNMMKTCEPFPILIHKTSFSQSANAFCVNCFFFFSGVFGTWCPSNRTMNSAAGQTRNVGGQKISSKIRQIMQKNPSA